MWLAVAMGAVQFVGYSIIFLHVALLLGSLCLRLLSMLLTLVLTGTLLLLIMMAEAPPREVEPVRLFPTGACVTPLLLVAPPLVAASGGPARCILVEFFNKRRFAGFLGLPQLRVWVPFLMVLERA